MDEEPIRSTESMSEYLTQVSVRSQSTIFTDAMRETQDFNLDPIQEVSIRESTPTDTSNPRVRRFSSFGEDSKDLPAIDSDEEEEGQEEVQNSTIQKECNARIHTFIEESMPVFEMNKFGTKEGPENPSVVNKNLKDRETVWKWENTPLPNFRDTHRLRVFTFTWNMYGRSPPSDLSDIVKPNIHHHIYAFATQECLRSIGRSLIYSNMSAWELRLSRALGEDYGVVKSETLGPTHLIIFAHKSVISLISNIATDNVKTGVGNLIKNKGGIAVSFKMLQTELLFVCCHLAAGQNNIMRRNSDFMRLEKEMDLPKDLNKIGYVSDRFDRVFWMGDMNYRINGSRQAIEMLIEHGYREVLLLSDQLLFERNAGRVAFGFEEAAIEFAPTYRFDVKTIRYDTSKKQRVPAWCDRILYKGPPGSIKVMSYDAIMKNTYSDHKPVFAQFLVNIDEHGEYSARERIIKAVGKKSSTCSVF